MARRGNCSAFLVRRKKKLMNKESCGLPSGMFSPTNRPCPRCGAMLRGPYSRWFQCRACRAVIGHLCETLTVHRAPIDVVAEYVAHCRETGNEDLAVPSRFCAWCGTRLGRVHLAARCPRRYCSDRCRGRGGQEGWRLRKPQREAAAARAARAAKPADLSLSPIVTTRRGAGAPEGTPSASPGDTGQRVEENKSINSTVYSAHNGVRAKT